MTLAVSDLLGLGVLECLCVQTQTVLTHFKREALREGVCGNKIRERRCAEMRSPDETYTLRSRKGPLHFWVPDKNKVAHYVRFLKTS